MKEYRNGWGDTLDLGPGTPDLSSDLEWVLQSGQSDANLVAEGLLHAYHAPVFRLCLALEQDPEHSRELLAQIFAHAVNQAYRYRPKTGIPVWFYGCLLQALPRPIREERRAHLPVLLHALADLDAEQIAALYGIKAERVEARLVKVEKEPSWILARAGFPREMTDGLPAGPSWRQSLQQRYPAPDLEDDELEALAIEVVARAEKRSAVRRRWVLLQELVLLLLGAIVVAGLILAADTITPGSTTRTPASTMIVTKLVTQEVVPLILVISTATPGPTPYPTPSPVGPPLRLDPLSVDSSPISIRERLQIDETFWETVWAEAITVLHGPPGYLGPDRIRRSQFWLGEDQARIQLGPLEGPPDELWLGNRGYLYALRSRNGITYPSEGGAAGSFKHPRINELGLLFEPLQPLGGEWVDPYSWQIRLTGRDRVVGREAVIVELLDPSGARSARLWLDTQTSFVLRNQQFRPSGGRTPAIEVIVTRILFDLDFKNQALFDLENPSAEAFANDPLGRPGAGMPTITVRANWESNPQPAHIDPPPGFDPAQSDLSFLYPPRFDLRAIEVPVDLFAAEYFLGNIPFTNPWWMVCVRSPDGRRIAFSSRPALSRQFSLDLHWLDLSDLSVQTQHTLPVTNVGDLAFSPDGSRLAISGLGEDGQGIYLADLKSGTIQMLSPAEKARSLAWSPDGEQIALIGLVQWMAAADELVVLDASSGKVVFHTAYEAGDVLPGNAPLLGWGADFLRSFPSEPGGLEACAAPPAQDTTP